MTTKPPSDAGGARQRQPVGMLRHQRVALMLAAALLTSCDTGSDGSETTSTTTVRSEDSRSARDWIQGRPLELPQVSASAPCPRSTSGELADAFAPGLGAGPVYPIGFDGTGRADWPPDRLEDGWGYYKVLWVSRPPQSGPYLVRGKRLDAPGEVRFNESRDRELRLRAGGTATTPGTPWAQWPSHIVLASAGCYGLQVDTHVNSHSVIFEVIE